MLLSGLCFLLENRNCCGRMKDALPSFLKLLHSTYHLVEELVRCMVCDPMCVVLTIDTLILFCDQAGIVNKDAIKIHGF
jgi:hypothetical protein